MRGHCGVRALEEHIRSGMTGDRGGAAAIGIYTDERCAC